MLSYDSKLISHSFIKLTTAQFTHIDTFVARIMAVYDTRVITCTVRPRAAIRWYRWNGITSIISFFDAYWCCCGSRRGGGGSVRSVCCVTAWLVTSVNGTTTNANDKAMFTFIARSVLLGTLSIGPRIVAHITRKVVKVEVDEIENIQST